MKINEIEAGEKTDVYQGDAPDPMGEFITIISEQCSDSIQAIKQAGDFLYRGLNSVGYGTIAFHGKTRENRQPNNLKRANSQRMFDNALALTGIVANRTNSIFCTGSFEQASAYALDYNDIFLIFPINGFKFSWSPNVRDPVSDMDYKWPVNHEQEYYNNYVIGRGYIDTDLDKAISSKYEIMVHGEYYAIRSNYGEKLKSLLR